jgi:outer membrane protein insertion porin family
MPVHAQEAPAPEPVTEARDDARPYEGRAISEIRFQGLERVSERLASNQLRTAVARPLEWTLVREDLRRLERLGEFERVEAQVELLADGTVAVLFLVVEAPTIQAIDVVGNTRVSNQEIAARVGNVVSLVSGVPIDEYRIKQAQRSIEELYRDKGFFNASVEVDRSELETNGVVLFRVREGERTQITAIRFEGNKAFPSRLLRPSVQSKTQFMFFNAPIDDETLDRDVAAIVQFYLDRGHLDARATRDIRVSPNGREAAVTFIVDEGPQYTLRDVIIRGADGSPASESLRVMSEDQIRGLFPVKPGSVYSEAEVARGVQAIRDAYFRMGYVDAFVAREDLRAIESPQVDVRLRISEGGRFRTGLVSVQGNDLTQAKVVRRRVDLRPGQWLDGAALEESERRLLNSGLFERNPAVGKPPTITIQPEDPRNPGVRDVLVEVEETNTGSLNFGAAVSSDAGLVGTVSLTQRNFDVADLPDSWDELFRGRAFRGGGQTFQMVAAPGTELSTYSISLTEPSLLNTDYGGSGSLFFRQREFDDYDEQRYGGRARIGRTFGVRWAGGMSLRAESVDVSNIDSKAPVDFYEVEGENLLTSVGFDLTRTTVDDRFKPTKGTRTEFSVDQFGLIGGDFEFTRFVAEHYLFFPILEDDFGRKTVVSVSTRTGYIPQEDESPFFERFYLGGRSFRGFDFRGIGPVGDRNDTGEPGDDHVGGDFLFFLGVEVQRPVWQDIVAVVGFIDSGTIADEVSLDEYRVSVGTGIRIYLPQLGQAPLAFDIAYPISKEDTDDEQYFSFSLDLPF